jgi:hypothetical protein
MNNRQLHTKITDEHRERKAIVYLRQSSLKQVSENLESQRLQYAMQDRESPRETRRQNGLSQAAAADSSS